MGKPRSTSLRKRWPSEDGSCSAHDHDGAMRMLGDAIGGRAEQPVTDEVSAVAEHDEVVAALFGDTGDQLCGVPRSNVDVDLDSCVLAFESRLRGERTEEGVLLTLDLLDLADGRGVGGQRALHCERSDMRLGE